MILNGYWFHTAGIIPASYFAVALDILKPASPTIYFLFLQVYLQKVFIPMSMSVVLFFSE